MGRDSLLQSAELCASGLNLVRSTTKITAVNALSGMAAPASQARNRRYGPAYSNRTFLANAPLAFAAGFASAARRLCAITITESDNIVFMSARFHERTIESPEGNADHGKHSTRYAG